MEELFLTYINKVGKTYEDKYLYEFLFSNTIDGVDGENWDMTPSSGRAEPPYDNFITTVRYLESELKLEVVQDSTLFAYWDGVDGVISIGWENIDSYDSYPELRLSFAFGEKISVVESKLYERDIILEKKKINYEKQAK